MQNGNTFSIAFFGELLYIEISTPYKIHIAICEKILPKFCVYRSNNLLTAPNAKPTSSILKGFNNTFLKIPSPPNSCFSFKIRFQYSRFFF